MSIFKIFHVYVPVGPVRKTFDFVSTDCSDLLKAGHTQSGVYSVNPDGKGSFTVYCDMRTDGGGTIPNQALYDLVIRIVGQFEKHLCSTC